MCMFADIAPSRQVELTNAVFGYDWDIPGFQAAGERSWNLKRVINIRLGRRAVHEQLPKALWAPLSTGVSDSFVPDIQGMVSAHCDARGWDHQTGFPTQETLRSLNLEDIAVDL